MRFGSIGSLPPVTKHLLIINIIIWLASALVPSLSRTIEHYCALYYFTSERFNVAQLITYMFIHFDFLHLFFNMFALFMFGMVIERALGSQRFLFYYITCGIGAALIQEGVFAIMLNHDINVFLAMAPGTTADEVMRVVQTEGLRLFNQGMNWNNELGAINSLVNTPVVGASGAIYGILLAFAMLFPNMPLYLWFIPIPIKAKWMVIGYAVIELTQAISNNPGDNVAHVAHLGGMLVGLILILIWRRKGVINRHGFY